MEKAETGSEPRLLDPADSAKLEQWLSKVRYSEDFIKLVKI